MCRTATLAIAIIVGLFVCNDLAFAYSGFRESVVEIGAHVNPGSYFEFADINGDGIPDLLAASERGSFMSIAEGVGDGTFTPWRDAITEQAHDDPNRAYPTRLTLAAYDLNGDGFCDLVATGFREKEHVSVFMGKKGGNFGGEKKYEAGVYPVNIAIGDLNGDGASDLVVGSCHPNILSLFLGKGDGTFRRAGADIQLLVGKIIGAASPQAILERDLNCSPEEVLISDLNSDGKNDLVVRKDYSIGVLLGNGDGSFQEEKSSNQLRSARYLDLAIGDLSDDGIPDLAGVLYSGDLLLAIGNGDGTFRWQLQEGSFPESNGKSSLCIEDIDGDGHLDLVGLCPEAKKGNLDSSALTFYLAAHKHRPDIAVADSTEIRQMGEWAKAGQDMISWQRLRYDMRPGGGRPFDFTYAYASQYPLVAADFTKDGARDIVSLTPRGGWLLVNDLNLDVRERPQARRLIEATRSDDIDGIKRLLVAGVDANSADVYGNTALMWASSLGRQEIATLLVAGGAEIDARGSRDLTALMTATFFGQADLVKILLAAGADPNLSDKLGRTALDVAVASGDSIVVSDLCGHGANPNARGADTTPICAAVSHGYLAIARELYAHGGDVNMKGGGTTPLGIAASRRDVEMVRYLLSIGAKTDLAARDGMLPVEIANRNGDTETANVLLQAMGVDVGRLRLGRVSIRVERPKSLMARMPSGAEPRKGLFAEVVNELVDALDKSVGEAFVARGFDVEATSPDAIVVVTYSGYWSFQGWSVTEDEIAFAVQVSLRHPLYGILRTIEIRAPLSRRDFFGEYGSLDPDAVGRFVGEKLTAELKQRPGWR